MLKRRIRRTWAIGAFSIVFVALWALWLDEPPRDQKPVLREPTATERTAHAIAPLDRQAFTAHLWNPPPPPPPAPKKEEETRVAERRPFLLQLIGIIEEGPLPRRAVLYDPQADKLFIVADGDAFQTYRVLRVTQGTVELSDGRSTRKLELIEGKGPS